MGIAANYGKVLDLIEERPAHHDLSEGPPGELLAGNSLVFLDLLLTNHKGEKKLLRVPVGTDVLEFYRG